MPKPKDDRQNVDGAIIQSGSLGGKGKAAPPAADKRKRPGAALPAFKVQKKEAAAAAVPLAAAAGRAPAAPVAEEPAAGGGLPGMDAYGDDDSD